MTRRLLPALVVAVVAATALLWTGKRLHVWAAIKEQVKVHACVVSWQGCTSTSGDLPLIAGIQFEAVVVDASRAGDIKMVGDIDGDGLPDLVLAGGREDGLVWYRYLDWRPTLIATPAVEFTTDGALGDIDGDGDLEIVTPDGPDGENLVWFENPGPSGDPGDPTQWSRHVVGAIGGWGKDIELTDFDGDGRLDIATRSAEQAMIFFQTEADAWTPMTLAHATLGEEGMASGDIDGDGDTDLLVQGEWLENSGGASARDPARWQPHHIGEVNPAFKALVTDLDQDGHADVLFSSSEHTDDVVRFTPATGDPHAAWRRQVIVHQVERCHTLQAGDLDGDGDIDLVIGQMQTSRERKLLALYNVDGRAERWVGQVIDDQVGLHNGVLADLGGDGDLDIFGANWLGNPPVRVWINPLNPAPNRLRLNRWTYIRVTDANQRTFGLAFGDIDHDGRIDIVSGSAWWHNPGADLTAPWTSTALPEGMDAIAVIDVDGDQNTDVIAQSGGDGSGPIRLFWLEAEDAAATRWRVTPIGEVPAASHAEGAQGYRMVQLEPGGRPEIAVSSGAGIWYFRIPERPEAGNWPRVHLAASPSDEGFAVGDIDGDGLPDVVATGGDTKLVVWYRNPGDGSDDWQEHVVGRFTGAVYPDRVELVDLDGDGRLDIVVSEENGAESGAKLVWWQAPEDPTASDWQATLLFTGATLNSMDSGDLDRDGDVDLVVAQHRGEKALHILSNLGGGRVLPQLVSLGRESHLGARLVDLDGDDDLDIVSIAWDTPGEIHLWRNNALPRMEARW